MQTSHESSRVEGPCRVARKHLGRKVRLDTAHSITHSGSCIRGLTYLSEPLVSLDLFDDEPPNVGPLDVIAEFVFLVLDPYTSSSSSETVIAKHAVKSLQSMNQGQSCNWVGLFS